MSKADDTPSTMSKATCRIRQVERPTFDMSPVAVLQVDGRGDKSPVFGDKSKDLNMFNSFDKSNIPATCRTRVSSMFLHVVRLLIFMFTALAYGRACAWENNSILERSKGKSIKNLVRK